jgi:hypothetical protein
VAPSHLTVCSQHGGEPNRCRSLQTPGARWLRRVWSLAQRHFLRAVSSLLASLPPRVLLACRRRLGRAVVPEEQPLEAASSLCTGEQLNRRSVSAFET